jgi:dTDP-4-amino-4,6-dideoxygalactose transaminase
MFEKVNEFENKVAEYFSSPYAVAVDSCTHAIELCLRHTSCDNLTIPTNTYVSIPMTLMKLGLNWTWRNEDWEDYYQLGNSNIIDAAVLWKENSYIPDTYMCLSFQYKKHLNVGRGGMILLQNKNDYDILKKMSYDGRDVSKPWAKQDIDTVGYHYYMTPETAILGSFRFNEVRDKQPKKWTHLDYPHLPDMSVFKC